MKKKWLLHLYLMTKYSLIGFTVQLFLLTTTFATNVGAQQIKSVKEVTIQVDFKNTSLRDVFRYVESKTDFQFTVFENESYLKEKISYKSSGLTVEELLLKISKENKLRFQQINNNIGIRKILNSKEQKNPVEIVIQGITITGRVTSGEDQEGLPGVNVIVKGSSMGTVTDIDGNYKLDVPSAESILTFSSVGFVSEEVVVGNQAFINVTMIPDLTALDEIVVVGYTVKKKSDITGSIASISSEQIDKTVYLRPIYLDAEYGYQFRVDYQAAHSSSNDQFNIGVVTEKSLDSVLTALSFATNGNTSPQIALMDFYPPESGTYYFYVQDVSAANQGYGLITDNFQIKRYTTGIPENLAVHRIGYNNVSLNATEIFDQSLQVEFTNVTTGKIDTVTSTEIPAKIPRMKPETEYSLRARFNRDGSHISSRWTPAITVYTNKMPPGNCVLFNGENEYFSFTPQVEVYSLEFWLYAQADNQAIAKIGQDVLEINNGKMSSPRIASLHINGSATCTIPQQAWMHVAINLNTPANAELIEIGRDDNGYFSGKMDELLLYTATRSQSQIRESMCRLPMSNEPDLYVRYHFEESLFEMINGSSIIEGMEGGSIIETFAANSREESTIPVGETGTFIQTTEPQILGEPGSEMTITALSEGDSANYLQAYVIGEGDVWVVEETDQKIADVIWGINRVGSQRADLQFNYSGFDVISNEDNLRLLRRMDKDSPWYDVSDQAAWNTDDDQILITNTTSFGEYTLGEGDYQTLDIDLATFNAIRTDSIVTLQWQMMPGSQTAVFRVFRQYDGQSMHKISDIPVTDLLNINKTFTVMDIVRNGETPVYYLEEISITGSSSMHGPFEVSIASGVSNAVQNPTEFAMHQNYPNPFNSSTVIEYSLNQDSPTTMQVYDILGRLVETLINEKQSAGHYKITWQVSALPSGVYWVVLNSNAGSLRQKVLYVR